MMSLKRIPWREAMKMVRIAGVATTLKCFACNTTGVGGTEPYESASSGAVQPEEWFVLDEGHKDDPAGPYCSGCAKKIAEAVDPTRSVTNFFSTTRG